LTGAGGRIDVVVPAHDERALIGACLRAVADDSADLDVRVVVVANGCTDDTADVARAAGAGVDLVVVELAAASKPAALNAANRYLRGVPVVYLDADTVLTPGTLHALLAEMDAAGGPVLAGPRPVLVRPRDRLTRGFAAVWLRLPSVEGDVIGSGCYAVNAAGRRRWGDFPDVVADDAFVRSLFTRTERRLADGAGLLLVLPAGRELIRVLARWRQGNAELADASPAAGGSRNARAVLAAPGLWRHVPAFLWVQIASRLRRREGWARADGVRNPGSAAPAGLEAVGGEADGTLYALAARFPEAGLYSGPVRRPSLLRAVAYGLGLTDPEPAPAVLIRRDLLRRLGGVDDRFGDHGAVIDLCVRARRAGVTPVSVPIGDNRPDRDPGDVLRDEILLHAVHLPAGARGPARLALLAGARFRRPAGRSPEPVSPRPGG
jgi:GT2 family glycosyltransferase